MENKELNPIFHNNKDKIRISRIENCNIYKSSVSGFNWRNIAFPYLHTHSHYEILIVVKGKILHTINNIQKPAQAGYMCILRPMDLHKIQFKDKKSQTLTFCFSETVAQTLFNIYPQIFNKETLTNSQPMDISLNLNTLEAVISKTLIAQFCSKPLYEQYCILIINRILSAYVEKKLNLNEAYPDWLNSFLQYLKNPEHLRMPIPLIAKSTNYSYSHLMYLFKKYTGKTLMNYIKELKIILAKDLLRNTDKSVAEIAIDLNYESVSSLNHNFKKITGITPLKFRNSHDVF